jgi:hypothetical protein
VNREAAPMPYAAVTPQVHQAFYVHGNFAAQVALHKKLCNLRTYAFQLRLADILDPHITCNVGCAQNGPGTRSADTVNIRQGNFYLFVIRNIYTSDAGHPQFLQETEWGDPTRLNSFARTLTLALFMARLNTNHPNHAITTNNFAVTTKLFNRCANLHDTPYLAR